MLLFNYVGFELPSSAGEEMTNPKRDVPFGIARSAVGSVLLYALPVLGILIVLPATAVTQLRRVRLDAMKDVFTVYGGSIAKDGTPTLSGAGTGLADLGAILFILCLLTSGVTWIMGSDRALAVSCYDGAGPRFLGVINARYGTPVRVNIFSGIVATLIVILAETITSGNAAKYFGAVLGVTISTTLISYLGIYPAVWKLRRSHPEVARPFRMPWMELADRHPRGADRGRHDPADHAGSRRLLVRRELRADRLGPVAEVGLPAHRARPGAVLRRGRRAVLGARQPHQARRSCRSAWPNPSRSNSGCHQGYEAPRRRAAGPRRCPWSGHLGWPAVMRW